MARPPEQLARPADVAEAFGLLSRLPEPAHSPRGGASAWAWPIAGLGVALVSGLVAMIALRLGVPPALAAGLALAAQIALTGGLHEDGLADSADGFWGGATPARRLEIMKDSRIGSYGVVALVLSLGLRWQALSFVLASGQVVAPLVAAAVLSRGTMAVLMAALPNARGDGLSAAVGRPSQATAFLAVGVALALGFAAAGWALLAPLLWLSLATIGLAAIARAKIGGQTGDVLGAGQHIGEIAVLIALASAL